MNGILRQIIKKKTILQNGLREQLQRKCDMDSELHTHLYTLGSHSEPGGYSGQTSVHSVSNNIKINHIHKLDD